MDGAGVGVTLTTLFCFGRSLHAHQPPANNSTRAENAAAGFHQPADVRSRTAFMIGLEISLSFAAAPSMPLCVQVTVNCAPLLDPLSSRANSTMKLIRWPPSALIVKLRLLAPL